MNPLDPDMDRDGHDDGQVQGSDPFFPEQSDVSPEEDVSEFLTMAIELEIEAYRSGSADVAASIMAGAALASLQDAIAALNRQALVVIAEVDYYQSSINDIRLLGSTHLEVDTCEVWTETAYSLAVGQPVSSDGPALVPQTVTIQQIDGSGFITEVQFYNAPAFCRR